MYNSRRYSIVVLAIFCLVFTLSFSASASKYSPGMTVQDEKNLMPVSQIKRGMRGYGLTVFQGTKIDKFDVEILGILKKVNTGKDLILVRVGGGPLTSRKTGVIAGMSGSPCYINGKMIGAIAYGWGFAKENVGMVTPIADMLESLDNKLPKQVGSISSTQSLPEALYINGRKYTSVTVHEDYNEDSIQLDNSIHMHRLLMPISVSGLSPKVMERFSKAVKPYGFLPVASVGGGSVKNVKAPLVPGAAVGVSFTTGDIEMAGTGTVTYRRGNKIVAFGHPMMGLGGLDFPMTTAYINDVFSSYNSSFKLSNPMAVVGRIFQDRPWSIAGEIGSFPILTHVKVNVLDTGTNRNKTFNVNIVKHPAFSAMLAAAVISEAVAQVRPTPGEAMAEVSFEIVADKLGSIKRSNVFFDPYSIESSSVDEIAGLISLVTSNKFYPLDIKSINVNVKIVNKREVATIDKIVVPKGDYEPGELVDVGVSLRPYKRERITKMFSIKIPENAADGRIILQVKGGASGGASAAPMGPGGDGEDMSSVMVSGSAGVDNVKQLVDKFLEQDKNNQIVLRLISRSIIVNVSGEKFTGLPSAFASVMKSTRNSDVRLEREDIKKVYDSDLIVTGLAQISINVKRSNFSEIKTAQRPAMSPGDMSPGEMAPPDASTAMGYSYDGDSSDYAISMAAEPTLPSTDDGGITDDDGDAAPVVPQVNKPVSKDGKKTVAVPPDKSAPAEAGKTLVKPVVRQMTNWVQSKQADFVKGEFNNTSASSDDYISLAPTPLKYASTEAQMVWCVLPTPNGVIVGTGHKGIIYFVSNDGKSNEIYKTGELEVNSLAVDSKGNLYAGTSPNGKIFVISPDGKGKLLCKLDNKFVLSLVVDSADNLYAAAGDSGNIYKVDTTNGKSSVFAKLDASQILCMDIAKDGSLIAGVGPVGILYKIDNIGKSVPVLDNVVGAISSLTVDSVGNIYAATGLRGSVYKITPDGNSKVVAAKTTNAISMTADAKDNIYVVSDDSIIKISPDESTNTLSTGKDKVQFLCIGYDNNANKYITGTANLGAIYSGNIGSTEGEYLSATHDAKNISKYGLVKWNAIIPDGASVSVQTRCGNVAAPDSSWSEWSAVYTDSGQKIGLSDARYIQYKVKLMPNKTAEFPKLSRIALSYMTPNKKPDVKLTAPLGGEIWAGKKTITWTGTDVDKDTLTYDVFYSNDSGATWNALVGGMTSASSQPVLDEKTIVEKVTKELEKSTDIPNDMKKQITDKPKENGMPAPEPSSDVKSSSNTTYDWDTTKVKDGKYQIKVDASDITSNGSNALTDEFVSGIVTICNTAPTITIDKSSIVISPSGFVTIKGSVLSTMLEIAGVQYRVDGGAWFAADAKDGIFDSMSEDFSVTTESLKPGTHKIEIQAVDAAGNAKSDTIEVKR